MAPAIGIDLGTVNSCVAVFINGAVEVIANINGNRTTPSYVTFTNNGRIVGDASRTRFHLEPLGTVCGMI